ncbi:PadR family transcriptional regulator [Sphingomonas panacisoli]|uniref:PadR family transcriptional regulator n=1 Tax=Sphingomonas panacisoli TaxID=1813879 RepID=UPI0016469742|nr:PadR family transcriptional regulator [Sphingomonas panacisoli]
MAKVVQLSRLESHVLALVRKWQPTTAYFVRKSLADTMATNVSDSPGSVYPAIERLKAQGLLTAEATARGKRASEHLTCTKAGEEAVQHWLMLVSPAETLPEDPWRTKIRFADLMSKADLKTWLLDLRQVVKQTAAQLDELQPEDTDTLQSLELEHARLSNAARAAWINAAMASLVE